ncbi:DUF305 domain-containing protein [Catellatospora coxensis]|uniref:DUF305 domain-containing protein n=1 Tax=Catellatospora coxensis TaxID=310354 RepID=A0A8J3KUP6_9ACTN|nr:DUF305 domain-containing protein [Catellatospora coxensis]GIG03729.1 hypothetical protein Cco03nite_04290 [Catellatospora coxensis]
MNTRTRSLVLLAAAMTMAGAAVTGCGATTATPAAPAVVAAQPSASGQFNNTDVQFAQQAIALRQQARWLAQQAVEGAQSVGLKQYATEVQSASQPQIDQLTAWLTQHNLPVPSAAPGAMASMPAMASAAPNTMPSLPAMPDAATLQGLSPEQFQARVVELFSANHEGLLGSITAELANGVDPTVKGIADQLKATAASEQQQLQALAGPTPTPSR